MKWNVVMTERDGTETILSTHDNAVVAQRYLKSYAEWDTRGYLKFRLEESA